MFRINMLPADHGDCLWVEYGQAGESHHVLIDGGTAHSYKLLAERIKNFPEETLNFELFVITHVDADHIGGSLQLLRNLGRLKKKIVFGDVWFNGWRHLDDMLGDKQGELVTHHLKRRDLPWNKAFGNRAVVVPSEGKLPVLTLPGGLRLTLLSPTREKLNKLRDRWKKTITDAGTVLGEVQDKEEYFIMPRDLLGEVLPDVEKLAAQDSSADKAPANGSSIAFLAEYKEEEGEKRCLFTGDAHPELLESGILRLIDERNPNVKNRRLQIDALKVSHHGSKNNISNRLLQLLDCPKYLFSTNGQQFNHPDNEAVARVIMHGRDGSNSDPQLFFNYKSDFNKVWDDNRLKSKFDYQTIYPPLGADGLVVEL